MKRFLTIAQVHSNGSINHSSSTSLSPSLLQSSIIICIKPTLSFVPQSWHVNRFLSSATSLCCLTPDDDEQPIELRLSGSWLCTILRAITGNYGWCALQGLLLQTHRQNMIIRMLEKSQSSVHPFDLKLSTHGPCKPSCR